MKKLKAGSLQLVTFIVVAIALLLSSFIILIHIHKKFRIRSTHIVETVGLVDKGIGYMLLEETSTSDTISLVLDAEDYKSVKVHKGFWGTYQKVYSAASIKNNTLKKTALVGSKRTEIQPSVLYLKDNNQPLVLVGQTKIKGNTYLPKRGVKSGTISGVSYYGQNYIYGQTRNIKAFPKINQKLLNYIETIDHSFLNNSDQVQHMELKPTKMYNNSFENELQLAYSESELFLSDVSLVGHIIIQSQTKIVVDKTAKLTDVILIAPEIEIKNNVEGAFQAFATKSIKVGQHVVLDYPSSLVLNRNYIKDKFSTTNMIFIDDYSTIKGNVLALGLSSPTNYEAQIRVNPNAIIKGIVYCEQNLELRGTVYGTVYTNNFIIKEKGSIYQNHLYNAILSTEELEVEFVSTPIEDSKNDVAKWLY